MSQKTEQHSTALHTTSQTPFDRFKEVASVIFQTPKSSIPKSSKKPKQKK